MNVNEQRVREFAYQIWESEGRPFGHSERHWEMASKLALGESSQPAPKAKKTRAKPATETPAKIQATTETQATAVTPPRKSRAKAATEAPAKSLIDTQLIETQPITLDTPIEPASKTTAAKKPAKPRKPTVTESESI